MANRIAADGAHVLEILRRSLKVKREDYVVLLSHDMDKDPFALLVAIVLSQNTNDKNSIRAYIQLRERIGVTLDRVLEAREEEIADAIRPAGLFERKARTIKLLANRLKQAGGSEVLLRMDPGRLRELLLSVPGVGKKTADVFLSFYRKAPVFAVDTHAARIAKRWGLVSRNATYDDISRALLEFFGPGNSEEAHRLLIALGRTFCRARNPRCTECPLRKLCPSSKAVNEVREQRFDTR
ncbi:MAG: endonuclease III [Thermoproteota archaeon]